jgi:hypothetical protein
MNAVRKAEGWQGSLPATAYYTIQLARAPASAHLVCARGRHQVLPLCVLENFKFKLLLRSLKIKGFTFIT